MIDNFPNVMIVPDANEKPEEIVEDYFEMIMALRDEPPEIILGLLHDMFDDVNFWSVKQLLIDQAKVNLNYLKQLEECEHEFIEDDED